MSLVGMGRAFNLRFMPNGPLRTNCYHRPMPNIGFGGGNVNISENVTINNGPTGFWGFMTGLTQGLFGGGMFGMGMGMGMGGFGLGSGFGIGSGIFGMLNQRAAVNPQGDSAQDAADKQLANLKELYSSKSDYHFVKNGDGTFTVSDGKKTIAKGSFDEVCKILDDLNENATPTEVTAESKAAEHKPPLEQVNGEWVEKDNHENKYTWDAENKQFNPVPKGNGNDNGNGNGNGSIDGGDGNDNGNGNGNGDGAIGGNDNGNGSRGNVRGARGAQNVPGNSSEPTKVGIQWDLHDVAFGKGAIGSGTVTYKGKTFTGTSNIPRSKADAKAVIAAEIEEKIKAAGLDKEITVYGEENNNGGEVR